MNGPRFLLLALGVASIFASVAPAAAGFPERRVRIIVPYAPGGAIDILARIYGGLIQERWNQPVIVENKPGANGQLGVEAVANAPADGYTVALSSPGAIAINGNFTKLPYDPEKSLTPIGLVAMTPLAIAANPSLGVSSFQDLITLIRDQPERGFNFSVSGLGAQTHLAVEMLKIATKARITAVPYKGTQPATTAIVAGEVDAGVSDLSTLIGLAQSGNVKLLAVLAKKRAALAPDAPTASEAGLPGLDVDSWIAMFAPAGTPADVIRLWNEAVTDAAGRQDVKARFLAAGLETYASTPAEAAAYIANEIARYRDIVKEAKIKLE